MQLRIATESDIPSIAQLRALTRGTAEGWVRDIAGYMSGMNSPQKGLPSRIAYVAIEGEVIIGFIAGHLTHRLDCEGELQWIDVDTGYRRRGIASELVRILAKWFEEQKAYKICVDPGNENARRFYAANGAENLNAHWMYWEDVTVLLK
jgi:ribosomal protein S18 acetylase RimI-like enzyme